MIYYKNLERRLHHEVLPGVKINPLQARRFAQALGTRAKTDPVYARMLAQFGALLRPELQMANTLLKHNLKWTQNALC